MNNMKISNSKVLVTGGAGFIGSNIIEDLLKFNNSVTCLDNFSTGKKENIEPFINNTNFKLIEGDIRDIDTCHKAVKTVDYILHQAALGSVPRSIDDPKTTNDVNIGGFVNMLIAAKDANIKRFVYAASSSTYGDNNELPKIEENIGNPLSPYAITKYVNELYAKMFSNLYNIETIGLRYFNVFGKRQSPDGAYAAVIPKFIISLSEHKSPTINGNGSNTRDFTYIQNVVHANHVAAIADNPKAINKVYNVAFGKNISIIQLFENIKNHLIKFDSKVSSINPIFGPPRKGDVMHSLASIKKAQQHLNYNPKVDVFQGLEKTVEWFWENYK